MTDMESNKKDIAGIRTIDGLDVAGRTVLLRLDINSPIDGRTKRIIGENRLRMSLPTLEKLLSRGAKLAIIAHQGDTLDYQNLIPMREHAERLAALTGARIDYIDDVAGPAAQQKVRELREGEGILLGNLRYLTEEVSTFENAVPLEADGMLDTWLVRSLAPLADCYVNDAFSAAHRNCPSMVAFQRILPTAGGELLLRELGALTRVAEAPERPCVFVLGGAKISDAFGMLAPVLKNGTADRILTCGVTGEVFLAASGVDLGAAKTAWLAKRGLDRFIADARGYLEAYSDRIDMPLDLAYEQGGRRVECAVDTAQGLPADAHFLDIGARTCSTYAQTLAGAGTIFMNGPAGAYETSLFETGTKTLWSAVAASQGYSVIGGGDTVMAAERFTDLADYSYVCTAGGAMVRFMSGKELPLVTAMRQA
ncbi:MAG: phosphoglycerate kinase, partial [Clostridiales Family XIII bacterium]|nr:phosphoglycerate kinase [Clostridiales Family XIII bacterium]